MQELAWIAEMVRVWLDGGSWADIQATRGFEALLGAACWLIPPTIIALGIGQTEWHETPIGAWLGAAPPPDDWVERACDLDEDGLPDF